MIGGFPVSAGTLVFPLTPPPESGFRLLQLFVSSNVLKVDSHVYTVCVCVCV